MQGQQTGSDNINRDDNTFSPHHDNDTTGYYPTTLDVYGNVWHFREGDWVRENPQQTADEMLAQVLRNIAFAQCMPLIDRRVSETMQQCGVVTADGLSAFFADRADELRDELAGELGAAAEDLAGAWQESLDDIVGMVYCNEQQTLDVAANHEEMRKRVEGIEERLWIAEQAVASTNNSGSSEAEAALDAKLRALEARFEDRLARAEAKNAELEAENERLRALVESSVRQTQASIDQSNRMWEPLRESMALLRKDSELKIEKLETKVGAAETKAAAAEAKVDSMDNNVRAVKKLVSTSMATARDRVKDVEALYTALQAEMGILHKDTTNLRAHVETIQRAIDPVQTQEMDARMWQKLQVFIQEHRDGVTEDDMRTFLRKHFDTNEKEVERSMAEYWPAISLAIQRGAEDRRRLAATAGAARPKK